MVRKHSRRSRWWTKSLVISALTVLVSIQVAIAQEIPFRGLVYNTKEKSAMTYDCHKDSAEKLQCDFVQTSVRKKLKQPEIQKRLAEAEKEFPNQAKEISSEKMCENTDNLVAVLDGKQTVEEYANSAKFIDDKASFVESMKTLDPGKKRDTRELIFAMGEFCKKKDKDSYMKFIQVGIDRDMKTCYASSNSFHQTFNYVQDYSNAGAWVVESSATGPCGVVQLSRFEKVITQIGKSTFTNWNYVSKKAVTNPKGTAILLNCGDLDEGEYTFEWTDTKQQSIPIGCDYIEFSPI